MSAELHDVMAFPSSTWAALGPVLTCREAEAVERLLKSQGRTVAAGMLRGAHLADDEAGGDTHLGEAAERFPQADPDRLRFGLSNGSVVVVEPVMVDGDDRVHYKWTVWHGGGSYEDSGTDIVGNGGEGINAPAAALSLVEMLEEWCRYTLGDGPLRNQFPPRMRNWAWNMTTELRKCVESL